MHRLTLIVSSVNEKKQQTSISHVSICCYIVLLINKCQRVLCSIIHLINLFSSRQLEMIIWGEVIEFHIFAPASLIKQVIRL